MLEINSFHETSLIHLHLMAYAFIYINLCDILILLPSTTHLLKHLSINWHGNRGDWRF